MSHFAQIHPRSVSQPLPSAQWSKVTTLSGSPAWLVDARRSISRIAELRQGWDGETSPAPQRQAIDSANRLLEQIERYWELPVPCVGPAIGGGVGIEWRFETRNLDLEVLPDGSVEYLKADQGPAGFDVNNMEDGPVSLDNPKEAHALIRWLMQGI